MSAGLFPIIGVSRPIQDARRLIARFGPTPVPVLLVGATGTGKELLAQHLHHMSGRRGELVDVNCGALPRDMIESLLFGHRRGAFSGAVETTVGLVEQADGGTLFLDELLNLPEEGQVKLLRVLESSAVRPLGDRRKRMVDLRVVAAVQEEVDLRLQDGGFRADLYQRVAGIVIRVPPLASRLEDVMPLAKHFASLQGRVLEPGVERVLLNYSWPRNVRELRMAIERAGHMAENGTLPPCALAEAIDLGAPPALTSRRSWRSEKLARVAEAGHAAGWDHNAICRRLSIGRSTLYLWLRNGGVTLRQLSQSTESMDIQ